jgi:hypothetical protein
VTSSPGNRKIQQLWLTRLCEGPYRTNPEPLVLIRCQILVLYRNDIIARMGGRVVEGTGLENRQTCKRLEGSNPSPSAINLPKALPFFRHHYALAEALLRQRQLKWHPFGTQNIQNLFSVGFNIASMALAAA